MIISAFRLYLSIQNISIGDNCFITQNCSILTHFFSMDRRFYFDKVFIGNIQKVCFIQSKSPLSPECTFDLVVATSTEITLVGVCLKDKNVNKIYNFLRIDIIL